MFDTADFQRRRRGKFGRELYYFEELESTNTQAADLARTGALEGTVVLANCQTGGKGRKGNTWFSPPDVNIYASIVLRPGKENLRCIPFVTGLAVVRMLAAAGMAAELKWPNDVLVGGRKIAGILVETSGSENRLEFAVSGCGINVNVTRFPAELVSSATSVALHSSGTSAPPAREVLLASFLLEFELLYEKIEATPWADLCAELEKHSSYLRGCQVQVLQEDRVIEGETSGLDAFGGLIIQTPGGGPQTVYAGEVQLCRKRRPTS